MLFVVAAFNLLLSIDMASDSSAATGLVVISSLCLAVAGTIQLGRRSHSSATDPGIKIKERTYSWQDIGKGAVAAGIAFLAIGFTVYGVSSQPDVLSEDEQYFGISLKHPQGWRVLENNVGNLDDSSHRVDWIEGDNSVSVTMYDLNGKNWDDLSDTERVEKRNETLSYTIGSENLNDSSFGESEIAGHFAYDIAFVHGDSDSEEKSTGHALIVGAGPTVYVITAVTDKQNHKAESTVEATVKSAAIDSSQITVSFENDGEKIGEAQGEDFGSGAIIDAPQSPSKDGYAFDGWLLSSNPDTVVQPVYGDGQYKIYRAHDGEVYKAKWATIHTVTFIDGMGNVVDTQHVKDGSPASKPSSPQRDGYVFSSWDSDFSNVKSDITVTAQWKKQWTVTFTDGMGSTLSTDKVADGEKASAPSKNPTRDGYDFKGWDADFSAVSGDMTVNAVWTAKPTTAQLNAVKTAKSYLNYTAFSYKGLIKQLKYEGYSEDEATYGADNCGADWMSQAEKMAASYMNYSSFSRSGLIRQLEYEGFTAEQAKHGVDSVGL